MNDLEQQLARQEHKRVPAAWRDNILRAAAQAQKHATQDNSSIPWWRALLWPAPRAWAALAAGWVLVALIQLTMPSVGSSSVAPATVTSAGAAEAWREQQRLLAELFPSERHAEPPKALPPRRRSERERDSYVV